MRAPTSEFALLDALVDPTYVVDAAWRILHLNPPASRIAGELAERFIGVSLWDAFPELVGTPWEALYRSAMSERAVRQDEIASARGPAWYQVSVSPLADGLLIQFSDITKRRETDAERKRAEQALRESELALAAVIRATPLAIETVDTEGRLIMWNPAAEAMLGWTTEEVLGGRDPSTPPDLEDEYVALHAAECEGLEVSGLEMRRRRKDGVEIDVIVSSAPLRDAAGEIRGVVSAIADVTERKRLEQQLLQAQKMDAVGRLAGGVAHDFNNLLTAISAYSELLLASLDERDPRCFEAQEIRQAALRGASLTRQLLSFSRKQVVQPQVVVADTVVCSLANLMRRLIGEDLELRLITGAHDACVKVDPGQLEQVLVNLVVNARDAMPNGGGIVIETSCLEQRTPVIHANGFVRAGQWVVITVTDCGCGMSAEVMSHMYEPFFTTKEPRKGTGLGLSTVYGIVKQSGGHVLAESTVGMGTTFRVFLPRASDVDWQARAASDLGADARGPETILLVEDEDVVRAPLRRILEGAGYKVLCASNGLEALDLAAEHLGRIDLLVTDMTMPQMGGRELVERLTSVRSDLKVLFMSGYAGDTRDEASAKLGPYSYLQKPFSSTVIRSKVREVLDDIRRDQGVASG